MKKKNKKHPTFETVQEIEDYVNSNKIYDRKEIYAMFAFVKNETDLILKHERTTVLRPDGSYEMRRVRP